MKNNKIKIAVFALMTVIFIPSITFSAVPSAMLEKSATYALGNTVHAFRLPTVNNVGQIKYYDVDVRLNVNPNGTITTANVTKSQLSPLVTTGVIAPGTYQETGGTDKCIVTNMTLTNGRIQSFFKCANGTNVANVFEFSVATGQVTAGHPFLAELLLKKVNTRTDVNTQTWGIGTTQGGFNLGGCSFGGLAGTAIGTKTNGNVITVNVINNGAAPNTYCAPTMTKIP